MRGGCPAILSKNLKCRFLRRGEGKTDVSKGKCSFEVWDGFKNPGKRGEEVRDFFGRREDGGGPEKKRVLDWSGTHSSAV
jgi:hypothetical protein